MEWAIAGDLKLPDSVRFPQCRPEATWAAGSAPDGGFDPVRYAPRNVFKVPGS